VRSFECATDGVHVDILNVALEGTRLRCTHTRGADAHAQRRTALVSHRHTQRALTRDSCSLPHANADDSAASPEEAPYSGPAFGDLDEKLQDAFSAFLGARGVDEAVAEYLVELSIDKEQREYVNWLKRTAAFVAPNKRK
jgi:hypothetical protein